MGICLKCERKTLHDKKNQVIRCLYCPWLKYTNGQETIEESFDKAFWELD